MALPPGSLTRKIKDILHHVGPLPDVSRAPYLHYDKTVTALWSTLAYVEDAFEEGVITQSDGVKLRLLARETVASPRLLTPTRQDLRYLKRFLDETAVSCNARVCDRLAQLPTTLHSETPGLFVPQELADRLAASFRIAATVAGAVGVVPAV